MCHSIVTARPEVRVRPRDFLQCCQAGVNFAIVAVIRVRFRRLFVARTHAEESWKIAQWSRAHDFVVVFFLFRKEVKGTQGSIRHFVQQQWCQDTRSSWSCTVWTICCGGCWTARKTFWCCSCTRRPCLRRCSTFTRKGEGQCCQKCWFEISNLKNLSSSLLSVGTRKFAFQYKHNLDSN